MKKTKMLKKNYEFRKVLSKGNYVSGKYIEAFILKNTGKNNNYLGIAIGVKIAKAVRRNRIKRLLKENYRLLENKIQVGNSIVFLWKKKVDIKHATFEHIKKDMLKILEKASLIKVEENHEKDTN